MGAVVDDTLLHVVRARIQVRHVAKMNPTRVPLRWGQNTPLCSLWNHWAVVELSSKLQCQVPSTPFYWFSRLR